jgi:hypothetical protein
MITTEKTLIRPPPEQTPVKTKHTDHHPAEPQKPTAEIKPTETFIEKIKTEEHIKEKKTIQITDEKLIKFFEDHFMDPTKFIQSSIDNYLASIALANQPNSTELSKIDLVKFNNEYNTFLNAKKALANNLRENIKLVDNMEFEHFDLFLCNKFGVKKETFPCTVCNTNSYSSKKALATHQRKCKKNNEPDCEKDQ